MKYRGFGIVREACSNYRIIGKNGKTVANARSFAIAKNWLDTMLVFRKKELDEMCNFSLRLS